MGACIQSARCLTSHSALNPDSLDTDEKTKDERLHNSPKVSHLLISKAGFSPKPVYEYTGDLGQGRDVLS